MDQPAPPYQPKCFPLPADATWPGGHGYPPYLFDDDIAVALDVALATARPLLVAGPPGSGKSMLAPAVADLLGWRFLRHTLTSRARLEELTGELDHLRRLHDAQAARAGTQLLPDWCYRRPGLLWWAFDPAGAARRGATDATLTALRETQPGAFQDPTAPVGFHLERTLTVLLLDEIDKAEPDLPNDLLEPLDRRRFTVPNGPEVAAPTDLQTLVIITTNGERELPQAFLRRCVSLVLADPDEPRLLAVAARHLPHCAPALAEAVAAQLLIQRDAARARGLRPPSTSEYLDALHACLALGITPDHPHWRRVERATLCKEPAADDAAGAADW